MAVTVDLTKEELEVIAGLLEQVQVRGIDNMRRIITLSGKIKTKLEELTEDNEE